MPRQELGRRIQELLDELGKIHPDDPEKRQRLEEVLHDIRVAVAESEQEAHEPETLRERFDEATLHFEESHPTLTAVIGRVADSLANLGI